VCCCDTDFDSVLQYPTSRTAKRDHPLRKRPFQKQPLKGTQASLRILMTPTMMVRQLSTGTDQLQVYNIPAAKSTILVKEKPKPKPKAKVVRSDEDSDDMPIMAKSKAAPRKKAKGDSDSDASDFDIMAKKPQAKKVSAKGKGSSVKKADSDFDGDDSLVIAA
jgi:hypothetical protein